MNSRSLSSTDSTSCRRWKEAWVRDTTECVVVRVAATAVATAAIVAVKVAATATESLGCRVDTLKSSGPM